MSKKVNKKTNPSYTARFRRSRRIREKTSGTAECPRMNVFRSHRHFTVQLIDDGSGHTLVHCSTLGDKLKGTPANAEGAKKIGQAVAEAAKKANIKKVIFDRNGYKYHGTIKVLADTARASGLEF